MYLGPISDTGEQLSKLNILTESFSVFYKDISTTHQIILYIDGMIV